MTVYTVYIVIGMHRSGTSLVSSLLHTAGIPMCRRRCEKKDVTQPYGYYEDQDVVELNRRLLQEAGGAWDAPPTEEAIAKALPGVAGDIQELISERAEGVSVWGFKDPRTTLTAQVWHDALAGHRVRYIFCLRNEADVVASLRRRNGKGEKEWKALRTIYNERAHRHLNRLATDGKRDFSRVVLFDQLVTHGTERMVRGLAEWIGKQDAVEAMMKKVVRR